jgi:hypothetical protein
LKKIKRCTKKKQNKRITMSEEQPSLFIIYVTVGDTHSHTPHTTAIGMFETEQQAETFIDNRFEGDPCICEVVPLNIIHTN